MGKAMNKVRMHIELSQDLADLLDRLASQEHTTKADMVRRAISVVKAFEEQRKFGRNHLGFSKKPTDLDSEMLGILTSSSRNPTATMQGSE